MKLLALNMFKAFPRSFGWIWGGHFVAEKEGKRKVGRSGRG